MEIKNIKEEAIRLWGGLLNKIQDSSWFYFLTEKYHILNPTHRKAINISLIAFLLIIITYNPILKFYSSYKNVNEFVNKKTLIQELNNLSSAHQLMTGYSQQSPEDLIKFLTSRIRSIQIPPQQIIQIKKIEHNHKSEDNHLPVEAQTALVELDNLNLSEIIQYGYQLENLSNNLKMTNIIITENPQKDNYFKVAFTLSFFALNSPSLKETTPTRLPLPQPNNQNQPKLSSKQTNPLPTSSVKANPSVKVPIQK